MLLGVVMTLVALFGAWWAISYFFAYYRLRDRLLLLQAGQGLAFALMFTYITIAWINQQSLSGILIGILILMALGAGFIWRMRGGAEALVRRYPRGMIDVLIFRKPAVDFKRRVRGR